MKIIVNNNISKKSWIVLTIFGEILGLLLIYVGLRNYLNVNFLKDWTKVVGEVLEVEIKEYKDAMNKDMLTYSTYVRYIYNVNGQDYTNEERRNWQLFNISTIKKGDSIDICYKSDEPQESGIYEINFIPIIFGIITIITLPLCLKKRMKSDE